MLVSSLSWQIFAAAEFLAKRWNELIAPVKIGVTLHIFTKKSPPENLGREYGRENALNCELNSQNYQLPLLQILSVLCMHSTIRGALRAFWHRLLHDIRAIIKSRPFFYFSYKENCEICQTQIYVAYIHSIKNYRTSTCTNTQLKRKNIY